MVVSSCLLKCKSLCMHMLGGKLQVAGCEMRLWSPERRSVKTRGFSFGFLFLTSHLCRQVWEASFDDQMTSPLSTLSTLFTFSLSSLLDNILSSIFQQFFYFILDNIFRYIPHILRQSRFIKDATTLQTTACPALSSSLAAAQVSAYTSRRTLLRRASARLRSWHEIKTN